MRFVFSESAVKDVKNLPKKEATRLKKKLLYWLQAPQPLDFAKPLTNHVEATHRFRLGAYRIIVQINQDEIRILRIRHRKDVYKK